MFIQLSSPLLQNALKKLLVGLLNISPYIELSFQGMGALRSRKDQLKTPKFGIALVDKYFSPTEIIEYAILAEKKGFSSLWIPEHYGFANAVSVLASLAVQTNQIKLATGIISPYTRHPVVIAMGMATVDLLSEGRVILGIGTGVRRWVEHHLNLDFGSPLTTIRESVEIIKKLVAGESVSLQGKVFHLENIRLNLIPRGKIPIYIGAVGPSMLRLAGQIGDGAILTAGSSPHYTRNAVKYIKEGAQRSKRDTTDFEIVSLLVTSVSKRAEEAISAVKAVVTSLFSRPGRAEMMIPLKELDLESVDKIRNAVMKNRISEAFRYITDEMVDAVTLSGTYDHCIQRLREYVSSGVTIPVLMPVHPHQIQDVLDLIRGLDPSCL